MGQDPSTPPALFRKSAGSARDDSEKLEITLQTELAKLIGEVQQFFPNS